jgi:hypothetical protein
MPRKSILDEALQKLRRIFPDMGDANPVVRRRVMTTSIAEVTPRGNAGEGATSPSPVAMRTITLAKTFTLPDGTEIHRVVRATVDKSGSVVKAVSSK